jgi:Fe-S cluster assembly scaffold protein SufB
MLQNSLKKAKDSKKKEANLSEDIDIEEFKIEEPGEHESVESLEEIPKKYQNTLLQVGVDPKSEERGGSFMMMGQSEIIAQSNTESIELLNIRDALEKYDWLSDYMWNAIDVDTDKYTAETALGDPGGFFIRANQELKQCSLSRHVCLLEMKD